MTVHNTGNPVGSTDMRDLYDNAQNLDVALHTASLTWNDRLGVARKSWAGVVSEGELSAGIYADVAAGLAATTNGKYFSVPSAESSEYLILYQNNSGSALEVKRYQSVFAGLEGVYNLVNPSAPPIVGGLNSSGLWSADAAYNCVAIRVDPGMQLVLRNSVQLYNGQYRFSFFSGFPLSSGTFISAGPVTTFNDGGGNIYVKGTVPAGAKYVVVNVKFNAEVINWLVAEDTAYNGSPAFSPVIARINDIPVADKEARKSVAQAFGDVEGNENLYTSTNSLVDRYITSGRLIGASSAVQAWRIAVVPVTEGHTYAVYFGPTFPDIYWQYGLYATGPLQANALSAAEGAVAFASTIDTQTKTFTVPAGKGITHAFINAKASIEDYTATLIVQPGVSVPVKPLPYVAALRKAGGKPIKDPTARLKIADLERRTRADMRFVGKKVYHFGDSITEGTEGGYVKYVQDILQCVSTNYGSSGSRTGRLVAKATDQPDRQTVGGAVTNPDYTDVAAVTIMIGTNDIAVPASIGTLADIPAQSLQDLPFTPSGGSAVTTPAEYWALFPNTFYGNLGLVIEYIKHKNSNTLIYLISPPHQNGADMAAIATALAEIAKHYSVRFIDAQNEAGLEKKQLLKYSYDGTHLNALGNELWGRFVGHRIAHS